MRSLQAALVGAVTLLSLPTVSAELFPWAAIGDSFSAGPGAGDKFLGGGGSCMRRVGSYPAQLRRDFPHANQHAQFLSCTGDKVPGLLDQIPHMSKNQKVVTISIGGNDSGFGRILKACVFKPGGPFSDNCDEVIAKMLNERIKEDKLVDQLHKAYAAVSNRISGRQPRRLVLVQLYPNFFNQETDWCDGQNMGLFHSDETLLTRDLRRKLNDLGNMVRDRITTAVESYKNPEEETWIALDRNNELYEGHRFCEPGHETLDNEDIWFFKMFGNDSRLQTREVAGILDEYDPKTCKDDPDYEEDFVFGWYCDQARYTDYLRNESMSHHA
ncbi:hypothetical protein NM208_g1269 [Fusarium decemcellulare]|uniref:Uncharacterized protein n=1 Tax=Fusarium decemcellulare TaxID=57161 RepID=A0ACC1SWR7_9HYPO|nr:hypothetical protein NM208_g1269 [Fusarium decemcellulare]